MSRIEMKSVTKNYKKKTALDAVTLTIEKGHIYGLLGRNGAGKTTLVSLIGNREFPTSGEVLVDGESLTTLNRRSLLKLRQNIGMIFQGFNLLEQRTVLKNVCFPL